MRQKARKYSGWIAASLIIILPIGYIASEVVTQLYADWQWSKTFDTAITGLEEGRPADGAEPYSIDWESNQSLLIRTNDGVYFTNESIWDKAYFGAATITVKWRNGRFYITELRQ